jgi:hypothetical protein
MKWLLSLSLLVFVFSCNENKPPAAKIITAPVIEEKPLVYIERAHLNVKNYRITFKTAFDFPDKLTQDTSFYFQGNYLMLYDKVKNSMDTTRLSNQEYYHSRLSLHDLSDSFQVVTFNIHWIGDSDIPSDEFVEYDGDSLKLQIIPVVVDSCVVSDTIYNAG